MADKATEPKKFQTRAGISRKSKEDRDQYAREEAARQQQRVTDATQASTSSVLEKGRAVGRGNFTAVTLAPNRVRSENTGGVFGAAGPSLPKPKGARQTSAAPRGSEEIIQSAPKESTKVLAGPGDKKRTKEPAADDPAVKSDQKTASRGRTALSRADDPIYVSSEEDADEDARRDIEQIWVSSDEEVVSSNAKGKRKEQRTTRHGAGLRPLRAPRDARTEGETLSGRNRVLSMVAKADGVLDGDGAVRESVAKDESALDVGDKVQPPPTGEFEKKTSKRKGARLRDTIAITETAEEHAERVRYNEEVRKLMDEFAPCNSMAKTGSVQVQAPDDLRNRRLHLFQLPPFTPFLVDPTEEIEVKQEPGAETATAPSASEKTGGTVVKKEEGTEEKPKKRTDVMTADNKQLPSGLVGTLRVHKSGKITLDWGGLDMEVKYGSEVDLLQDIVMTDESERTAWALGQVEKKMVCIPNWQKLYE